MTVRIKSFLSIIFAALIIIVLLFSIKAYANDHKTKEYRETISENEDEYVHNVRIYLNDMGFKNAGINLTKSFDEDRNVTYSLIVNHHSFEYANADKLAKMENDLYFGSKDLLTGNIETKFISQTR